MWAPSEWVIEQLTNLNVMERSLLMSVEDAGFAEESIWEALIAAEEGSGIVARVTRTIHWMWSRTIPAHDFVKEGLDERDPSVHRFDVCSRFPFPGWRRRKDIWRMRHWKIPLNSLRINFLRVSRNGRGSRRGRGRGWRSEMSRRRSDRDGRLCWTMTNSGGPVLRYDHRRIWGCSTATYGGGYIPTSWFRLLYGHFEDLLEFKGDSPSGKVDGWRRNAKQRKRQVTLETELNSVMLGGQNFQTRHCDSTTGGCIRGVFDVGSFYLTQIFCIF